MDGNGGPVVSINLFKTPAGADEGFIAAWERARDLLTGCATSRPSQKTTRCSMATASWPATDEG
jgi:hypothetical protein